jgi:RHS repeat-associated protein
MKAPEMKRLLTVIKHCLLWICLAHISAANSTKPSPPPPVEMTTDNTTYFHLDPAGTPLMATNEAGAVVWKETYLPYGEKHQPSIAGGTNTIGYAGKPYDNATGLSYMGARYYNPTLGRFTGIDPVGFNPDNLHSHNRYAYANNNPYKYVDPDGRVAFLAAIPPALAYLTPIAAGISARIAMSSVYRFGMSMAIGETGFVAPASLALGAGKVASVVAKEAGGIAETAITAPYKRPSNATTSLQREFVQGKPCVKCGDETSKQVAGHKKALVEEYYETGAIDKARMRSVDSIQAECPSCSAREGADMSRYSREMKAEHGFK